MKMQKKWGTLCVCLALLVSMVLGALPVSASAAGTITYSKDGKISYSPDVYAVETVLYGKDVGADSFVEPVDRCRKSSTDLLRYDDRNLPSIVIYEGIIRTVV